MASLYAMGGVPKGIIAMWSGALLDLPSGWALCDGANGTPDLRGRFVVGSEGAYAIGETGGANSVTLTEGQMPSHNHTSNNAGSHDHTGGTSSDGYHGHSASSGNDGYHSHSGSTNTTGNHRHSLGAYVGTSGNDIGQGDTVNGGSTEYTNYAGNHSHSLSINANGTHNHTISIVGNGSHTHSLNINSAGNHSHTINNTGGNQAHENRPPYFAIAYIMKVR